MDPARSLLFSALLEQTADLPPSQREDVLRDKCSADASLRASVQEFWQLRDSMHTSGFLPSSFLPVTIRLECLDALVNESPGGYRITERLGQGGMGCVYRATHPRLDRSVAVKILGLVGPGADWSQVYTTEKGILSQLQHDSIADILDAGVFEWHGLQLPYLAMELLDGSDLPDYCRSHNLTIRERLLLFCRVCDAVEYAHKMKAWHLDLKPSNIRVTSHGVPKVLDFGLGRLVTEGASVSASLPVGGTFGFMSPEQARATSAAELDFRSDVYSLGAVCYWLLSGRTPHQVQGLTTTAVRRCVASVPPKPLGTLVKVLRGDLENIVATAMHSHKDQRYQSAAELKNDIDRYLTKREVLASRPWLVRYRVRKLIQRKPVHVAGGVAVLLSLLIGLTTTYLQMVRANRHAQLARTAELQTKRSLYVTHCNLAQAAWDNGDVRAMHSLHDRMRPEPGQPDLRSFEWYYLWALSHGDSLTLPGYRGPIAVSADGELLAAVGGLPLPFNLKRITVWSLARRRPVFRLEGHAHDVTALAFSPSGRYLATGSADGELRVWSMSTGTFSTFSTGPTTAVRDVCWSRDESTIVVVSRKGRDSGQAILWKWHENLHRFIGIADSGVLMSTAFSPDGSLLACGDNQGRVLIWHVEAMSEPPEVIRVANSLVGSLAFAKDGNVLVAAGVDSRIRLLNLHDHGEVTMLEGHNDFVTSVAASPDGNRLISGSLDMTAIVWDIADKTPLRMLRGHTARVADVAFIPGSDGVVSSGDDATVRVWHLDRPMADRSLTYLGRVSALSFSPNGRFFAAATRGPYNRGRLRASIVREPRPVHTSATDVAPPSLALPEAITSILTRLRTFGRASPLSAVMRDLGAPLVRVVVATGVDRLFAVASAVVRISELTRVDGGELGVYDVESGECIYRERGASLLGVPFRRGHLGGITALAVSPDSNTLASASHDGTVLLRDIRHGRIHSSLVGHPGGVQSVAFAPTGHTIVTAGQLKTGKTGYVMLWENDHSPQGRVIAFDAARVRTVRFSPDGRFVVAACADGIVMIFELATSQWRRFETGQRGDVYDAVFSRDGKMLATGGGRFLYDDVGEIKLFTWEGLREMKALRGHRSGVFALAFSPDGRTLASASADNTVKLWDIETGEPRLTFSEHSYCVECVAFSPDGLRLASGGWDATVKLRSGTPPDEIRAWSHGVRSLTKNVSPSGQGNVPPALSSHR